jgi:cytochrome c biogenesis protein CcmG/thiol:disulfide interchange protein DsbE
VVGAACATPEVAPTSSAPSGGVHAASVRPTPTPTLDASSSAPAATATASLTTGTDVGQLAPEFTLTTTEGAALSLSDLRGRPAWIVFWAPGCPSCDIEMGMMDAMYQEHQDSGLEIVGIAVSTRSADAAAFGDAAGITYPLAVDTAVAGDVSAVEYQVYLLPTHYFIDRDGIVRAWVVGDAPSDIFEEKLARIIDPTE